MEQVGKFLRSVKHHIEVLLWLTLKALHEILDSCQSLKGNEQFFEGITPTITIFLMVQKPT